MVFFCFFFSPFPSSPHAFFSTRLSLAPISCLSVCLPLHFSFCNTFSSHFSFPFNSKTDYLAICFCLHSLIPFLSFSLLSRFTVQGRPRAVPPAPLLLSIFFTFPFTFFLLITFSTFRSLFTDIPQHLSLPVPHIYLFFSLSRFPANFYSLQLLHSGLYPRFYFSFFPITSPLFLSLL